MFVPGPWVLEAPIKLRVGVGAQREETQLTRLTLCPIGSQVPLKKKKKKSTCAENLKTICDYFHGSSDVVEAPCPLLKKLVL